MANLSTAQADFQSTFITWLNQLTPNSMGTRSERFSGLTPEERDEKQMRERTGNARQFDLDLDRMIFIRHDYVGADTQGVTFDYPLIIAYPRENRWQSALVDDYILIRDGVLNSLVKPAGTALVIVPEGISITQAEQDPWSYSQITIRVTFDVTIN